MSLIDAAAIQAEAESLLGSTDDPSNESDPGTKGFKSLFRLRTAEECLQDARLRPVPKMLFGEFWFEGEICILFADTNVGKSILAVQIADSISKGERIDGIPLEAPAQTVVYFDFELSDKQFEARYSERAFNADNYSNHYRFDDRLIRAEIDPDADIDHGYRDFEEYLHFSLKHAITSTDAKVLIIDNLTYLKNETERAKDALPLMKYLKALKTRFGLSILALAHTPKRDLSKQIILNDLQGSKMLSNFCDSLFAIGESSKEKGLRYLKQLKARNVEIKYHAENVYLCQIQKPSNFLHFTFDGFGSERDHLRDLSDGDRENQIERAKDLSANGRSQREIAEHLGVSAMTVNRYLRRSDGEV